MRGQTLEAVSEAMPHTGGTCERCHEEDVPVIRTGVWKQQFDLCLECRELPIRRLEDDLVPALRRLRQ